MIPDPPEFDDPDLDAWYEDEETDDREPIFVKEHDVNDVA